MKEQQPNLRQFPLPGFEESLEDGLFREFLPYSDLNQWIPEHSVYNAALLYTPLLRLGEVSALSFLSYIGPPAEEQYFKTFSHHRLDHSLVVALTTERILRQNGQQQEKINIGILAGLVHDIATPALGDAIKQVDPDNLDEEKHWMEVIDQNGRRLLESYGTNEAQMDKIIKNEGVLGKVLDIADRITYVMKDMHEIIGTPVGNNSVNFYEDIEEFIDVLSRFPKIGNIYQDVGADRKNGNVFFSNPDRLEAFLLLRALLHQKLYMHPVSLGRDLFVKKLTEPLYSPDERSDKPLSPHILRQMNDHDLKELVYSCYSPSSQDQSNRFRHAEEFFQRIVSWHPEFEKFATIEDAQKREEELRKSENIAVVGIKECKGFDPATSYKVADGYRYVEFREFDPSGARQIEAIAESTKGIFLIWADVSQDSPTNTLLRAVLKK